MIKTFYKNLRTGITEYQDYIFEEIRVLREQAHKYCYVEFGNYPPTMRLFVPHADEYKSLEVVRNLTPEQKAEEERLEQERLDKFNSSYVKVADLEIPYDAFNIDFTRIPDLVDWKAYREMRSDWYPNLSDFCGFNLFNAPTYGWHFDNDSRLFRGCRIDVLEFALHKWLNRGKAIGLKVDFDDRGGIIVSKGHLKDKDGNPIYPQLKEFTNEEIRKNFEAKIADEVEKGYYKLIE